MSLSPGSRLSSHGSGLDGFARALARKRSLQDLDTWARRVGFVFPPVRDYRDMRAIAVTGASEGLESYVSYAVRGRVKPRALWEALDRYADGDIAHSTTALSHVHARRGYRLAWLLLQLHESDKDLVRTASLIRWLTANGGRHSLNAKTRGVLLEALLLVGQRAAAAEVLMEGPVPSGLSLRAKTDLANPYTGGSDHQEWLNLLNAPWVSEDRTPVSIADAETPFHGLEADAPPVTADTKVSVVVSSYCPDSTLLRAVRSVLKSSWQDIEVLVVDDASGPEYSDVYEEVLAMDPRVRFHAMKTNGGTYGIRNWALDHATGEFITFHDSDDWMHPDRIAVQMDFLRTHPAMAACVTPSIRVTQQLQLVNKRSLGTKLCEPSLMFNREKVPNRIGGFDTVRKAGDAEFRQRLEAAYGSPVPIVGDAPLTLQLLDDASLSGGDIKRYTVSLERRIYRACYEQWHSTIRAQGEVPRLDAQARVMRQFYAPNALLGMTDTPEVDAMVTGDLLDARRRSATKAALREARTAAARGSLVGVRHFSGPWRRGRMSVNVPRELITMLNDGSAVLLDPVVTRISANE